MAYVRAPDGTLYDDQTGMVISRPGDKSIPEAPSGNLQAGGKASGAPLTPTPESDTNAYGDTSGTKKQSQQQQPQAIRPRTSAQDYADWANNRGAGGRAGAVYDAQGNVVTSSSGLSAQAAAGAGSTMDASGAIRDPSGNVWDSSANLSAQDVGGAGATMPGGGAASGATTAAGGGGMMSGIAGGIGAIGQQIAEGIKNSVPGWKMQASHIPSPTSFEGYQPRYDFSRRPTV